MSLKSGRVSPHSRPAGLPYNHGTVVNRYHLDVVRMENQAIWITLVVDDPVGFYVEQYYETNSVFTDHRTRRIEPDELSRHWVNNIPLIKLVEKKFEEIIKDASGG